MEESIKAFFLIVGFGFVVGMGCVFLFILFIGIQAWIAEKDKYSRK